MRLNVKSYFIPLTQKCSKVIAYSYIYHSAKAFRILSSFFSLCWAYHRPMRPCIEDNNGMCHFTHSVCSQTFFAIIALYLLYRTIWFNILKFWCENRKSFMWTKHLNCNARVENKFILSSKHHIIYCSAHYTKCFLLVIFPFE